MQGIRGIQGEKGDSGDKGDKGERGLIGPAPIKWQGEWQNDIDYLAGDGVQYQGSSYLCMLDHTSSTEDASPGEMYWDLFASKGAIGSQGTSGDKDWSGRHKFLERWE